MKPTIKNIVIVCGLAVLIVVVLGSIIIHYVLLDSVRIDDYSSCERMEKFVLSGQGDSVIMEFDDGTVSTPQERWDTVCANNTTTGGMTQP